MKNKPDSNIEALKEFIRNPYAWSGGYPKYAITNDGGCLCKRCCKEEYRIILKATKDNDNSGWNAKAVDINWEDQNLYCEHCNDKIEPACGDDD